MQKNELVLIYDAPDQTTAEIVCATLHAAGIQAVIQSQYRAPAAGLMTYLGQSEPRGVLVAASDVLPARTILEAPSPTEEELTAEQEANPLTLAEAEARVKNA